MGRDKSRLPFRNTTLADSVAHAVAEAAGSAVLVGSPAHTAWTTIPDLFPGEGPLGGILTALHHTSADWNLIAACDMPELTADFLRGLLAAAEAARADVLMPAGPSGRPEPLCAVYRAAARDTLAAKFDSGVRKITTAFDNLHVVQLPVPGARFLNNVNTPMDWAEYAAS